MKSFHQLSGSVTEKKHRCIILSESELVSLKTFSWIRSPRISDDESEKPIYHNFKCLSDTINHWIYLKVAHRITHNSKSEVGRGRHVILSGHFKDPIEATPFSNGLRAGISHASLAYEDSSQFVKVYLVEFMAEIQVWSAITDQFHCANSASGLMSRHVLFHESVSASLYWMDSSILSITSMCQTRKSGSHKVFCHSSRTHHPHLQSLLFKDSEFRVGLHELEFTPSFMVHQSMEIRLRGRR